MSKGGKTHRAPYRNRTVPKRRCMNILLSFAWSEKEVLIRSAGVVVSIAQVVRRLSCVRVVTSARVGLQASSFDRSRIMTLSGVVHTFTGTARVNRKSESLTSSRRVVVGVLDTQQERVAILKVCTRCSTVCAHVVAINRHHRLALFGVGYFWHEFHPGSRW